jgi:hypothetical protein
MNDERDSSSDIPHCCREERHLHSTVNFDLVAGWLERCDEHHNHSSNILPLPDEIIGFRFIDVQNRCIVRASHHVRYAALSYTWGSRKQYCLTKQNTLRLEESRSFDGLEEELGPTVLDSMKVCSRLSIPYLWIDALCIVQDDTENKHAQIQNMDHVYANAYVTLVDGDEQIAPDVASLASHSKISGLARVSIHTAPNRMVATLDGILYHLFTIPRGSPGVGK